MLPALKVGGTYPARVVALLPDRRVRLALTDGSVDARCEAPLTRGETVTVEVDRLFPEVVLRVRRPAGAAGGRQEVPGVTHR